MDIDSILKDGIQSRVGILLQKLLCDPEPVPPIASFAAFSDMDAALPGLLRDGVFDDVGAAVFIAGNPDLQAGVRDQPALLHGIVQEYAQDPGQVDDVHPRLKLFGKDGHLKPDRDALLHGLGYFQVKKGPEGFRRKLMDF